MEAQPFLLITTCLHALIIQQSIMLSGQGGDYVVEAREIALA